MYSFLVDNQAELIGRCKAKVALRPQRHASAEQLEAGIPLFLHQLTETLKAEEEGDASISLQISGPSGGDGAALSEIGNSAAAHGATLLGIGYTVDQVVHDYGDMCQAISDLAFERNAQFSIDEFRSLNRCLDNAIADAVVEFSRQRDLDIARETATNENHRLGFLVHELRNHLNSAGLAFEVLESGKVGLGGSTSGIVKRSFASMSALLAESMNDVRSAGDLGAVHAFAVASLIADVKVTALMYTGASGLSLSVSPVDPALEIFGNRMLLAAALMNLVQNAFKFTGPGTEVLIAVRARDERVMIDVQDHCGGLPEGSQQALFKPFAQAGNDRSGLGLGLSIARRSVEADGGKVYVHDLPGSGCVFTIELPRLTR